MEMQDLINAIDMSKLSSWCISFEEFANELRIPYYSFEWKEDVWDLFTKRVKGIPIYTWREGASIVGIFASFLDSELVCLSFQRGRKEDINYYWLSKEAAISVSDFIETLKDDENPPVRLLEDFEEPHWDWDAIEKELHPMSLSQESFTLSALTASKTL